MPTLVLKRILTPALIETASLASPPPLSIFFNLPLVPSFVVVIAALVARLTGLLAPFPPYTAILVVFAHHLRRPGPARQF